MEGTCIDHALRYRPIKPCREWLFQLVTIKLHFPLIQGPVLATSANALYRFLVVENIMHDEIHIAHPSILSILHKILLPKLLPCLLR